MRGQVERLFAAAGPDDLNLVPISEHGIEDRWSKLDFAATRKRGPLLIASIAINSVRPRPAVCLVLRKDSGGRHVRCAQAPSTYIARYEISGKHLLGNV